MSRTPNGPPKDEKKKAVDLTIASIEKQLGQDGRVLVRYSGTESKVRVMIEGTDQARIQTWAQEVADALARSCRA